MATAERVMPDYRPIEIINEELVRIHAAIVNKELPKDALNAFLDAHKVLVAALTKDRYFSIPAELPRSEARGESCKPDLKKVTVT